MRLKRETYLEQIRPYYESDIIKVITGVRRAGKSILLDTIKEELIDNGISQDHIIYLNFEDIDFDYILKYLKQNSQKDQTFETTLSGPHRDRIDFVLNHHLFVPTASTGQCRLISLLLRVAQAIFYSKLCKL